MKPSLDRRAERRETSTSLRPRAERLVVVGAALALGAGVLSSCTLVAGQPWGQAELDLAVAFEPDETRLTDDGRLKTSRDFGLDPRELALGLGSLRLTAPGTTTTAAGSEATFDPASPPPGYGNCHNGHCHHEDGRLVDYEDIEAELAGGGGSGPVTVVGQTVTAGQIALWPEPGEVELEPCADDCHVDRVTLTSVEVSVTLLTFTLRVTDLRPVDRARLPAEGVLVTGAVPLGLTLDAPLDERFDRDQPIGMALSAVVEVAPTLFDGVDFDALVPADPGLDDAYDVGGFGSVGAAVVESLSEDASLFVDVERFEPDPAEVEVVLLSSPSGAITQGD